MAAVMGLGHVGLYVRDLERMVAFYRDTLGMRITKQNWRAGIVFLSADVGGLGFVHRRPQLVLLCGAQLAVVGGAQRVVLPAREHPHAAVAGLCHPAPRVALRAPPQGRALLSPGSGATIRA